MPLPVGPVPPGLIDPTSPPPGLHLREPPPGPTTLHLRNLNPYTTNESVFRELGYVGLQTHADFVHVVLEWHRKRCLGQAYVNFSSSDHAATAWLAWQNKLVFGGCRCVGEGLSVAYAKTQGFEACVQAHNRTNKHRKDTRLKPWVRPDKVPAADFR